MRKVVLWVLYLVVAIALLYAAAGIYTLIELWKIKLEIGALNRDLIRIGVALVFGVGLPYCMIHYLKKNQ